MKIDKEAIIVTPYKLKDEELQMLKELFPYLKKATIENQIDKDLIGGFIIESGATIFDASIKGKINYLISRLYESDWEYF